MEKWCFGQLTNCVPNDSAFIWSNFITWLHQRWSENDNYKRECGSQAANFVRDNFYVDDGLKSVSMPAKAIDLIQKTKMLCKKGGFRLHKIISNSKEVIEAIPPKEREKSIQDLDPTCDALPIERALGVQWCVESDTFKFRIELAD